MPYTSICVGSLVTDIWSGGRYTSTGVVKPGCGSINGNVNNVPSMLKVPVAIHRDPDDREVLLLVTIGGSKSGVLDLSN